MSNPGVVFPMWETTFARNTQAGFCKENYESNILFSIAYGRKVLTKSGLGISRKCCFPHGVFLGNVVSHMDRMRIRRMCVWCDPMMPAHPPC